MENDHKSHVTRAELEIEIKHLRELLGERDKQLVLQAKEYERRLEVLNGAHTKFFTIVTVLISLAFSVLAMWLANKSK